VTAFAPSPLLKVRVEEKVPASAQVKLLAEETPVPETDIVRPASHVPAIEREPVVVVPSGSGEKLSTGATVSLIRLTLIVVVFENASD
jgi:hypothetical protein